MEALEQRLLGAESALCPKARAIERANGHDLVERRVGRRESHVRESELLETSAFALGAVEPVEEVPPALAIDADEEPVQ
ncbi:MAG TPA: hypothetical protein VLT33_41050 [Labilithrix sp.]|nr:hypothetical protein [Labilithrix sp.]